MGLYIPELNILFFLSHDCRNLDRIHLFLKKLGDFQNVEITYPDGGVKTTNIMQKTEKKQTQQTTATNPTNNRRIQVNVHRKLDAASEVFDKYNEYTPPQMKVTFVPGSSGTPRLPRRRTINTGGHILYSLNSSCGEFSNPVTEFPQKTQLHTWANADVQIVTMLARERMPCLAAKNDSVNKRYPWIKKWGFATSGAQRLRTQHPSKPFPAYALVTTDTWKTIGRKDQTWTSYAFVDHAPIENQWDLFLRWTQQLPSKTHLYFSFIDFRIKWKDFALYQMMQWVRQHHHRFVLNNSQTQPDKTFITFKELATLESKHVHFVCVENGDTIPGDHKYHGQNWLVSHTPVFQYGCLLANPHVTLVYHKPPDLNLLENPTFTQADAPGILPQYPCEGFYANIETHEPSPWG